MLLKFLKKNNGVAALSTTLLIGGIIVEIASAGILASYLVSQEGLGLRASYSSFFVANSGAEDALLKITRYGDTVADQDYSVVVGDYTASVNISKVLLANNDSKYTITSVADILNKKRSIQAITVVDYNTKKVSLESITDV